MKVFKAGFDIVLCKPWGYNQRFCKEGVSHSLSKLEIFLTTRLCFGWSKRLCEIPLHYFVL